MARVTLATFGDLGRTPSNVNSINANFQEIADKLDELLSREGEAPNTMEAPIDMNDNQVRNLAEATNAADAVPLHQIEDLIQDAIESAGGFDPDSIQFASEAEAVAGTSTTTVMSPSLTKAAIIAWQPVIYATRYGVSPDNTAGENTSNWNTLLIPAHQAAATDAERPVTVLFENGEYLLNNPLVHTSCTKGFKYQGQGHHNTTFQTSAFGRSDKLFQLDCGFKSNRVKYIDLVDFRIAGNSDVDDPIGVYQPWVSTSNHDFKVVNLRNTAVRIQEADNSELSYELTGCGWQDLIRRFDGNAYAQIVTTAGPIVTLTIFTGSGVASPEYTDALEGLADGTFIYIESADQSDAAATAVAKRAISGASGASAVLDFEVGVADFDQTEGLRVSTGPMLVSGTHGSAIVTTAVEDVITALDVGREYYIKGASESGGVGCFRLEGVAGNQLTFNTPLDLYDSGVLTDVEMFTAPPFVIMHNDEELLDAENNLTNDIQIDRLWIEAYDGPAFIIGNYTHVRINNGKTHGKAAGQFANFASSRENEVWTKGGDSVSRLVRTHANVGGHPTPAFNGGNTYIAGGNPEHEILGSYEIGPDDQYAVEFIATSDAVTTNTSGLHWGPARCQISRKKSPWKLGGVASLRNILHRGRIRTNATATGNGSAPLEGLLQAPSIYTSNILLPQNDIRIWTPGVTGGKFTFYNSGGTAFGDRIWEGYIRLRNGALGGGVVTDYTNASTDFAGVTWAPLTLDKDAEDVVLADGTNTRLSFIVTNDNKIVFVNRGIAESIRIAITCRNSFD